MNKNFVIIISVATFLLVGLLIALSIFQSKPQTSEQVTTEIAIPTAAPNNQSFTTSSSNVRSNTDLRLNSADTNAIENTVKKLPLDSAELKIEYSELLNTFYVQNTATDGARLKQFLTENNLSALYSANSKLFKLTDKNPKDIMDEDEFVFGVESGWVGDQVEETSIIPTPSNLQKAKEQMKSVNSIFNLFLVPNKLVIVSPAPTSTPAGSPQSAIPANTPINVANCNSIVGNEKIVCSALKYTGIRYGYASNAAGNAKSKERWGVVSQGRNGHDPATWIAKRIPGGSNDFLECSGYVAVAIYDAFGVVEDRCSVNYYGGGNFKKIDINAARAGDLLIKGTGCATSGGGGHVGIFVKRNANGRIQTLESTSRGSGRSGPFEVGPTYFDRAARYTGPGSTP